MGCIMLKQRNDSALIKTPSKYLGLMLVVIAVLLALSIILILSAYNATRMDMELVNKIGKIRGGIQKVLVAISLGVFSDLENNQFDHDLENVKKSLKPEDYIKLQNAVATLVQSFKNGISANDTSYIYDASKFLWEYTDMLIASYINQREQKRKLFIWGIGLLMLMFMFIIAYTFLFINLVVKKLEPEAMFDTLTGILRRGRFIDHLMTNITSLGRNEYLGLLMYDLDHFKRINDTYGHDVGDIVLKETTAAVSRVLRPGDMMGRLGGEEFAILVRSKDRRAARLLADRVRSAVENTIIPQVPGGITASVGVIVVSKQETAESALKRVDEFLYAAKMAGRNRVRSD